ncbi:MAG: hypothetical protein ABI946_07570 [Chthoniobacterales bacterium]
MKEVVLFMVLVVSLTGCSFSQQGRQQRTYQKYVRKSSAGRQKQQSKFRSDKPQMPVSPMPSEPTESTASGPQAMPAEPTSNGHW